MKFKIGDKVWFKKPNISLNYALSNLMDKCCYIVSIQENGYCLLPTQKENEDSLILAEFFSEDELYLVKDKEIYRELLK